MTFISIVFISRQAGKRTSPLITESSFLNYFQHAFTTQPFTTPPYEFRFINLLSLDDEQRQTSRTALLSSPLLEVSLQHILLKGYYNMGQTQRGRIRDILKTEGAAVAVTLHR